MNNKQKQAFRLTLSHSAYFAALKRSKPIASARAIEKANGDFDVFISTALANLIRQIAFPKENLSDTVLRVMKEIRS